jgi:hypothetical protein
MPKKTPLRKKSLPHVEEQLQVCARELRIAQRVQQQAGRLLQQGSNIPGVQYRAEDAQSWAEDAAINAGAGYCARARVSLRAALKYWRRARLKAAGEVVRR